jgi:hypothetical protein
MKAAVKEPPAASFPLRIRPSGKALKVIIQV